MKLTELLNQLNLGNLSILLFLVLSLVEISPIKINPWSMLIQWLARLLGIVDLKTEIIQVRDRMDELEKNRQHENLRGRKRTAQGSACRTAFWATT